jgi:hypothetical protein
MQIVSETEHYVIRPGGRREKKITESGSIFDTFEEAKRWLLDMFEEELLKENLRTQAITNDIRVAEQIKSASGEW